MCACVHAYNIHGFTQEFLAANKAAAASLAEAATHRNSLPAFSPLEVIQKRDQREVTVAAYIILEERALKTLPRIPSFTFTRWRKGSVDMSL